MSTRATYAAMQRQVAALGKRMETERRRIAEVIASMFVREDVMMKLGDYSDADLKGLMELIVADIDTYAARFDAAKKEKQNAAAHAPKHGAKPDNAGDAATPTVPDGDGDHATQDTSSTQTQARYGASDNRFVQR